MATLEEAQDAWSQALSSQSSDQQVKALFGGGNFRINVAQALKAAYLSAKLYVEGKLALATGSVGPMEIAKLGKGAWNVVVATLDALRESMHPANYALCLVLSGHEPEGLTEAELKAAVLEFVNGKGVEELPWYMGISGSFLAEARKLLQAGGGFEQTLEQAREDKFVSEESGRLRFKERHFEWGFRLG